MSNLKKASIKIGTNPQGNDYVTEFSNQYLPVKPLEGSNASNVKMKEKLKGHHFELQYGHTGQYNQPMSKFNKGRTVPSSVKSSINATAENYAHNFKLGYGE